MRVAMSMRPNITSDVVLSNINRLYDATLDPANSKTLDEIAARQESNTKAILETTNACSVPMLRSLQERISGLKAHELHSITRDQLQNPAAMNAAMCVADSLFYVSPYDLGSITLNNRIRLYLHNLRLTQEYTKHYDLISDFENTRDMFAVKVAKSPDTDNLSHELLVGLYGTNQLRQMIPNFNYIYGGFKCSPPLLDPDDNKVVAWCLHSENAVNYIVSENLEGSLPMSEYIHTCSNTEFLSIFMQVVYSLYLANRVADFTHYNLNHDNVRIRIPKGPTYLSYFQIAYETENGPEYITTRSIPTIINYETAHIILAETITTNIVKVSDQVHYGKSGYLPYSVFPYRSFIMYDIYKFLMYCMMEAAQHNNKPVYDECAKIFRYWNQTEDPMVAISNQLPYGFPFPYNDDTKTLTVVDFVKYVRDVCNCDFISPVRKNIPICNCETVCLTEEDILSNIGMSPEAAIPTPDNVIEFFDIASKLQNQGREDEKQDLARRFPYTQCMRMHIHKMEALVQELQKLRQQLKIINVRDLPLEELLNYNTMKIVRSMYITVGRIVDTTITLRFMNEIGNLVAISYADRTGQEQMANIMKRFETFVRPGLEDAKRVLGMNHEYLNSIKSDSLVKTTINTDPRLLWYWDGRNMFDVVFGRVVLK